MFIASLQILALFLLVGTAIATTPASSTPTTEPEFTYCDTHVLHLVINGRPISPAEHRRYVRCDPMLSAKAIREFSLDAAPGRVVKAQFDRSGTTLYVTIVR